VYPECEPDAHSCSTNAMTQEASNAADEAVTRLLRDAGSV
jgi:hypothetical protein